MKNNVAIVTGASQGIGRATALRLAKDFSSIVLAARNGDALKEVAKAVDQAGARHCRCHSTFAIRPRTRRSWTRH